MIKKFPIILLILIAIEIFYFSSIPGTVELGGPQNIWIPRAYHVIVFFLFTFFLLKTINQNKKLKPIHILITLMISITQAILDETHQIFVPLRNPSFTDVLTDSIGILLAILIYIFIDKKSKPTTKVSKEHYESLKKSLASPHHLV